MGAVIDYTTEAGIMRPVEAVPQIKMKKPAKDSSLGSLLLPGASITAPFAYLWRWVEPVEQKLSDISPYLILPQRLVNPLYGREDLDMWLKEKSSGAPDIKKIWQITEKLPSLTDILLEERNNE